MWDVFYMKKNMKSLDFIRIILIQISLNTQKMMFISLRIKGNAK
jgi:hypothetical protein